MAPETAEGIAHVCVDHTGNGRRWNFCLRIGWSSLVLLLITAFVSIMSLAYASPVDPSWIIGLYDASDFDDVVSGLIDATGTGEGGSTVVGAAFSVLLLVSSVNSWAISDLAASL